MFTPLIFLAFIATVIASCDNSIICSRSGAAILCRAGYRKSNNGCEPDLPPRGRHTKQPFSRTRTAKAGLSKPKCKDRNALTCAKPGKSTTCKPSFVLAANKCLAACPYGSYPVAGVCTPCPGNARRCDLSGKPLACNVGLVIRNGHCVRNKRDFIDLGIVNGTFFNGTDATSTNQTTTGTDCGDSQYMPASGGACQACSDPFALECPGDVADTCVDHYQIPADATACALTCDTNQFTSGGMCSNCTDVEAYDCDATGMTIDCYDDFALDPMSGNCVAACSGFTDASGACVDCADPNAQTCTNATYTTACYIGYDLDANFTCVAMCEGYTSSNGTCTACNDPNAFMCLDAATPTQCLTNYALFNGTCISECVGYSDIDGNCQPCTDPHAYSCTATNTTLCNDDENGSFFLSMAGVCELDCPISNYDLGGVCIPCADPHALGCEIGFPIYCANDYDLSADSVCTYNLTAAIFYGDVNATSSTIPTSNMNATNVVSNTTSAMLNMDMNTNTSTTNTSAPAAPADANPFPLGVVSYLD